MSATNLQVETIKQAFAKKGYKFFERGKFNLNIIGIRGNNHEAGMFDDALILIYYNDSDELVCESFAITTDAGTYWLQNPMNAKGTALLVPNQYLGCYQIGKHQGKYDALVQRKPVSVYRDNDKDLINDYDPSTIETGMFGINIHRSNPRTAPFYVDKWSAGCQVFQDPIDFLHFMSICFRASRIHGNSFTYTLLEQNDITSQYV